MQNVWFVAALRMSLAFLASLISIWTGISVALIEILVGVIAGNFLGVHATTEWINFLALLGAGVLTFLAGAEIDPRSLKANLRVSGLIGILSFGVPFVVVWLFASCSALTKNWYLAASSRLPKPLTSCSPFGLRSRNSSPSSMPRFGVIRFAMSPAMLVSRPSGLFIVETVGSESSSFTNGSSVERVAGKKRAPANPWPLARSASANATTSIIKITARLENFISHQLRNSVVITSVGMLLTDRDLCKTLS